MTADEIRGACISGQRLAMAAEAKYQQDAAMRSLTLSMLTEVAAQIAELNETLLLVANRMTQ